MLTVDWPQFVATIRAHQSFLLTSHVRPDCDALGSELGMAGVLTALGKKVRIVNPHPTPPNLAFIDPAKQIKTIGVDAQPTDVADIDLLMILDTSAWQQLEPMRELIEATSAKKIAPVSTTFGITNVRYGPTYAARSKGAIRSGFTQGLAAPIAMPSPRLENTTRLSSTAAVKRAPRNSCFEIGVV